MSFEVASKRNVVKHYGPRQTGGAHGQYKSIGPVKTLSFKINKEFLEDADAGAAGLNTFLPAGASVITARIIIKKVFSSTATITFFGSNSQGNLPIAANAMDEVGTFNITPTANLAVGKVTTQETVFSTTAAGTVPGTAEGEGELLIEYILTELA